jgi:guanylate kinase
MRSDIQTGHLVIISGPSGVGKSTVVQKLLDECQLPLALSVSATTRAPRQGEVDGVSYHFLTYDDFQRRREAGEFLECFEPYGNGVWYGTLRETVATGLKAGKWVLLEIEVNGALEVMRQFPDAISIFLLPESKEILENRLRGRNSESEEAIRGRLARAHYELSLADRYRHHVVNCTVAEAVQQICNTLNEYGAKDT